MSITLKRSGKLKVHVARIKTLYTIQHLTLREIAEMYGASVAGVRKVLLEAGVTAEQGEQVSVACAACQATFKVARAVWKRGNRHYCNLDCYTKARCDDDETMAWIRREREKEEARYESGQ